MREAGIHGFYTAFSDATFTALLTLATAPALFFGLLSHGGGLVTIVSQYLGSKLAQKSTKSQKHLALFCALQSILLFILVASFYLIKTSNHFFAGFVCAISLLSLFVGNLSSPVWHSSWATSFSKSSRKLIVSKRSFVMTSSSFLAVIIASLTMISFPTKIALSILLIIAATGKLFSAINLYFANSFPILYSTHKNSKKKISKSVFSPILRTIITLHLGIGISLALVIPYLIKILDFSASEVFALGMFQVLGQLILTAGICKKHLEIPAERLLSAAMLALSVIPILMCSASSLVSWLIIFFLNGSAMGALSIAVQYLAQTPSNPRTVAGGFSSMVISSTSAQILGGMIGALIFLSFSNTIQQAYIFVFLTSALVRCMAILMPKAIKADETEDLFTESEALQEAI
jgi:hypothetical protein